MAETPEEIVKRLQTQVDAERKQAIEVQWTDAGPYRLPRCNGQQGGMIVDQRTLELQLETEKGQRVLIPLDVSLLEPLGAFLTLISKRAEQRK
jgi:hypothetical protein